MKNFIILLVTLLTTLTSSAQDITGQWNGVLKVQGTKLFQEYGLLNHDGYYIEEGSFT